MANRYFKSQFRYGFDVQAVDLLAKVSVGAAGAPTLDSLNSIGVTSIVRNGAGDYTVKLNDPYPKLRGVSVVFDTSGVAGGAPASPVMSIKAQSISASGGGTVDLLFSNAGVATDPGNGEVMYLHFMLNNSNVAL